MTSDSRSSPPPDQSPRTVKEPINPTDSKHVAPKATSSVTLYTPVPATSFYGSTGVGSSHTGYIAPASSPFREFQLVEEAPSPEVVAPDATYDAWGRTAWQDPGITPWDSAWSGGGSWGDTNPVHKVPIDGRSEEEELNWADAALRANHARPGPGMLPPMLADMLHDPQHALYHISITPPDPTSHPFCPSPEEVRTSVPHPHAYYCKEHNGWVILIWRSSTVLPPLERAFDPPLPDMARRKQTTSCVGDGEQPFGQVNITHHWHHYEHAVDSRKLNPPFMREDTLLDLYVCCQCSTYCLVSDVIPGVVPAEHVKDFVREKYAHPSLDRTPHASVASGFETILTILNNRLWRDEQRSLPVHTHRFQQKLGWNDAVRHVFETVGFAVQQDTHEAQPIVFLKPPPIDPSTLEGKQTRAKLLRAWVELNAWLAIYLKSKNVGDYVSMPPPADASEVREMYQMGIGAHVSQIPRGLLPETVALKNDVLAEDWRGLGMTPATYSWELLTFAYLAQCRCDPAHTPKYFTCLSNIVQAMVELGEAVPELQQLIMDERNRHRYTSENLRDAITLLGFGRDNELKVDLDDEVDDEFILRAWRDARRRAWRDTVNGSELRMRLNEALKFVADDRGSAILRKAWEEEKGSGMSPDAAYTALGVPTDVDDGMLITVYGLRVDDQPSQAERMREALTVIAEVSGSERLQQFIATGRDPGDATHVTTPEMPRGLNQLGNTCYLNSLLQYFYTIKDLREAITPLSSTDTKALDDSKFTDDDLKRHRVGGRLVTRREILRSKRFVHQLADLFWNLEYCEVPAVTPTIDLAKLALVTSQDEEEDDQDRAGTDSSNDTDATLVEDAPPRLSSPPPLSSPTDTILGKRNRDVGVAMDIDSPPDATGPSSPASTVEQPTASSSKLPAEPMDVEMQDVSAPAGPQLKPPPLPARKPRRVDDSVMMFGRQHDVSECMDNCMFQIETALLDFEQMTGADDDKTSVIKRLFYGKKRQRLTPLRPAGSARYESSIHEKEDLFSHLHVNVSDEGFDLYDGLARYFDDVVEFDGQKKRMEVTLVDLPPLLQIQLQRVQFDRETQQAYKSQAYVKFGETIYMDRFLDTAEQDKKARAKAIQAELNASRDHVQRLTKDKHAPFAPALGGTADFLSKQDAFQIPEVDDSLIATLSKEQDSVTAQLEQERSNVVRLKSEIEEIWKDDTSATYELTSVFVHRGSSPSWGHYFFYSRNLPDHPNQWFKYNDSDVSIVSKDEVLADTTGSTANPYMLVFARKGSQAIHTVHRFDPQQLQDG